MRSAPKSKSNEINPYLKIFFIFITNFLIRTIFIFSMKNNPFSIITRYTVDSFYYHNWALSIVQGNWLGNEVFFLGPFYAYFLAIIYRILGSNIIIVQTIQSLLSSFGVLFLYLIVRRISNHRNALIASIIYTFSGILIFFTGALLYVEVNIFFSLFLAYLLIKLYDNYSIKLLILSAVICGLLIIVRPEFILLLILAIPYFIIKLKPRPIPKYLFFSITTAVIISVIPIRNYIVGKDFVPFTTHSGINFYYGNNPKTDGTWRPYLPFHLPPIFSIKLFEKLVQEIDGKLVKPSYVSSYSFSQGINFITHNPGAYLKLQCRKFLLFINSYEIPNDYYFYQARDDSLILKISVFGFGFIFPCAILGIILSAKRWKDLYLLYSFIFIYFISSLIFYVISRLRAPAIPFLIIFAAFFISEFINRLKSKKYISVLLLSCGFFILYGLGQLRVIDIGEYETQGYVQKGNIYLETRNFTLAADNYHVALSIRPNDVIARYSLLQADIRLNRMAEAKEQVRIISDFVQRYPQVNYYAYLAQGRYDFANANYTNAASEFEQALKINPHDPEIHYQLGAVYSNLGKNKEALAEMQRALQIEPEYENAQRAIYSIRNKLQQK